MVAATSRNSSVYIGDLAENVTEQVLYDTFSRAGSIQSVRLCRESNSRKSLGYGYINYQTPQEATRALETMNHIEICGRPARLMPSQRDPAARRSGVGNIFVKNFDPDRVTNKVLHETFEQYGVVLSAKVATDAAGRSKGYGFIQFEDPENATRAIKGLNNTQLCGQPLFVGPFVPAKDRAVEPGKFCNVYVRNVGPETDEAVLRAAFGRFGPITSTVVMRNGSGKSRGFGFVNFEKADHAARAVEEMNGYRHAGIKWRVNRAQKREDLSDESDYQQHRLMRSNLYLRNLHAGCTDQELQELFEEFGDVENARVLRDSHGESKGVGFVQFVHPEDAEAAITGMNGKTVGNSPTPLFVTLIQKKQAPSRSNSGGLQGNLMDRCMSGGYHMYPQMSGQMSGQLSGQMSGMLPHNMAYFPGNPMYAYSGMPVHGPSQLPYFMPFAGAHMPVVDRMGSLISLQSGLHPGMTPALSAPSPRMGYGRGISGMNSGPLMVNPAEGRASAPLPTGGHHGVMPDGHERGRKSRGRQGVIYNPQVLAYPPAMPAPPTTYNRASPFSTVQTDVSLPHRPPPIPRASPNSHRGSGGHSPRQRMAAARTQPAGGPPPALPKPMTPAMIQEASDTRQRSKQNQLLLAAAKQQDAKLAPRIVQCLMDSHDLQQASDLLGDREALKNKIQACVAALHAAHTPAPGPCVVIDAVPAATAEDAPATSQAVVVPTA